ncbi:MAG TPA: DUF3048 domain-containing protein [Candidatus Saccharimonadales bacterium]
MNGDRIFVRREPRAGETSRPQLSRTVFRPSAPQEKPTVFQPPEVVEEHDEAKEKSAASGAGKDGKGGKKHRWSLKFWENWTKKHWWIASGIAFVVVAGGVTGTLLLVHSDKAAAPEHHQVASKPKPKPAPVQLVSTLTGLPISSASVNQLPVTAVMIENSTFARPQSGLDQAGVVFEARAEGGITRFVALYQDSSPSYVGPVRSVRPYYIEWLLGFDAAVAHVGGSGEALADLKTWNVKNLDQEANGSYFTRITSRAAPHNVYTSIANLNALEAKRGYGASNYTGFVRKAEAPAKTPSVTSIDFNISSAAYAVHYDYNATTNSYERSEGGAPHMEVDQAGNKTQIAPKVVVALVMSATLEADGLHMQYGTIGSGPMYVFQDGNVEQGTWHKTSNTSQFTFTDASGKTLALNPGQTWITALGASNLVSYK